LGARHRNNALGTAAKRIEAAVDAALKNPATRTADLGGNLGTREFAKAVVAGLS
jgi:isocitrate/isopropylmalate dehydrogenase